MHSFLDAFKRHGSNHESRKPDHANTPSSTTQSPQSERSKDEKGFELCRGKTSPEIFDPADGTHLDAPELAALVAQYGHAPATAWLESARYCIWRPSSPVPQSSFLPVQGYLQTKGWIFAWGSPLVSDKAALEPTLTQFIAWAQSHDLRLIYCCVPEDVAELLADRGWCTVSCISEDIIDPPHILQLTQEDDKGGHGSMVKDLKKNLRRAERANVQVKRILKQDWSSDLRQEIEDGIAAWKRARRGPQLAAMSLDPWLDFENREYWIALQYGRVVGFLILTPTGNSYVVKNAVQFPNAPKGTSEQLIHSVLRDLHERHSQTTPSDNLDRPKVSFNISAASDLRPTRNISRMKFTWLNQTYTKIASSAHLLNRHDFRRKFDTISQNMFICYPAEDGAGLDGIEKLLMLLLH